MYTYTYECTETKPGDYNCVENGRCKSGLSTGTCITIGGTRILSARHV